MREPVDVERVPVDERVFDHVRVLVLVVPVLAFAPTGAGVERGPVFGAEIDTGLACVV
jgi:hypothetical protein